MWWFLTLLFVVGLGIAAAVIVAIFAFFATGYRVLTGSYYHELEKVYFYFCLVLIVGGLIWANFGDMVAYYGLF